MADLISQQERAEQTFDTIKCLIRYNIPPLILGSSSIGKSETLNWLGDTYRIKRQMLFIGSEKAENIEGIPNIRVQQESGKLTYFKPYWFPDTQAINEIVENGRNLFNRLINGDGKVKYIDQSFLNDGQFAYTYNHLNGMLESISSYKWGITTKDLPVNVTVNNSDGTTSPLTTQPFVFEREIPTREEQEKDVKKRDDIRDICSYLSTLLGYGNFWLILDEIDKVDENDTDKYAPLLHIVRERHLKGWSLVEINDKKGIDIPTMVENDNYIKIKQVIDNGIENKQSLLDTRVVAIGNETAKILQIMDALFRRFVQVFVKDILVKKEPSQVGREIHNCFMKANIPGAIPFSEERMADWVSKQNPGFIEETNLQWEFGFLPKIVNSNDPIGNFFRQDIMRIIMKDDVIKKMAPGTADYEKRYEQLVVSKSALYRLLTSNFQSTEEGDDLELKIMRCLIPQIRSDEGGGMESPRDKKRKEVDEFMKKLKGDVSAVATRIVQNLKDQSPKSAKEGKTVDEIMGSVDAWVNNCYDYIYVTMVDKDEKFGQTPLNKTLIPRIQALILFKIAENKNLEATKVADIMRKTGEFWKNYVSLGVSVDVNELDKALHTAPGEGVITVYGAKDSIAPGSASFNMITKNRNQLAQYIVAAAQADKLSEIDSIKGFKDYIVKFEYATIKKGVVDPFLAGKDEAKKKLAGRIQAFFE